jgi:hypothetical protein
VRLPRMTTRRWMMTVAIVAAGLGLYARSEYLEAIAIQHRSRTTWVSGAEGFSPEQMRRVQASVAWHGMLADKYHRAARRPWLPVPPDPPEPK